ncbi:argininosuccinate lyase [compost metagenome]
MERQKTILCLTCVTLGRPFMIYAKQMGARVIVLTADSCKDDKWPKEIDRLVTIKNILDPKAIREAVDKLIYQDEEIIDLVVALADQDVENGAMLRDHLRLPGMKESEARFFRDKLAMRMKAQEAGIPVPPFTHAIHRGKVFGYMQEVEPPYMLKVRDGVAAVGVSKITRREDMWPALDKLGGKVSNYLVEKYTAGDVYHVDSIVVDGKVQFAVANRYGVPIFDLQKGGSYVSMMLDRKSKMYKRLIELNEKLIPALGKMTGITHAEYIHGKDDDTIYFLEAAARVGASKIPDVIYSATGVCLWHEWVKMELDPKSYKAPKPSKNEYAGAIFTVSKHHHSDLSKFNAPEVVWTSKKPGLAGLMVHSPKATRVEELLTEYDPAFAQFR